MTSLRARLLLTVSLVSIAAWSVAIWVSYAKSLHETDELLDGQLVQAAELLHAQIEREDDRRGRETQRTDTEDGAHAHWVTEAIHHDVKRPYDQSLIFVISDSSGVRLRSANAPEIPDTLKNGIANIDLPNGRWRVLTVRHAPDLRIHVAHLRDTREQAALEVAWQVAMPPLFALPLLIGLVYLAVRRGLQPLNTLANTVSARTADHLDPIIQPDTPDEARPLLDAINKLFARIDAAMTRERRFTSEAAHELRTPIAAIKIQAQVAAFSTDAEDRSHALSQVLQGIQRAERLIGQMLRLARLDPATGPGKIEAINPAQLLQEVFESTEGIAMESGHRLTIAPIAALAHIQGDDDLLRTALTNLVHNACKHTPPGCLIQLCAELHNGQTCLAVRDDGPGVAPDEIAGLGLRFHRGRDASATGSGLGLAIVNRIAELHGATLKLHNLSPRGFEAALYWKIA